VAPPAAAGPSLASCQLDAIALRIQHNALVVTIPSAPRSFQHRMAVSAKPVREAIHYSRPLHRDTRGQLLKEMCAVSAYGFVVCGIAAESQLMRSLGGEMASGVKTSFSTE